MKKLVLKQNHLSGKLPQGFSRLTNLQFMLLEQNNLEGDAQVVCESDAAGVDTFVADCDLPPGSGARTRFTCSCCSACCKLCDSDCNLDWKWSGDVDSISEYGYRQQRYNFEML